jgi:hypothetical protein
VKTALFPPAACRTLAAILTGIVLAIAFPHAGSAQTAPNASDVGVWKLNLAKSRYGDGLAPKSNTLTIPVIPRTNRLFAIGRGIDADGQPTRSAFIILLNGKVYSPIGAAGYEVFSNQRGHTHRAEDTRWSDRNIVQTGCAERSNDGRTLRFTIAGSRQWGTTSAAFWSTIDSTSIIDP